MESEGINKGSTFVVRLPLSPVYHVDETEGRIHPTAEQLVIPLEQAERLDELTILVVDDENDARELLTTALGDCRAKVLASSSAVEGLEIIKTERPDVLISDIGMPGVDGYDFIKQVRALPAEEGGRIPAVALTAYARTEDRLKALRAGYQMHVPKPVELTELIAVIASLVHRPGF